MKMLGLSDDLFLPLDAVTRRLAWLGTVGSGKTYGASKLAELMIEASVQIVVLDPVGVWYGLRLAADGKKPGIPIPVFGGLHGDIPLESTGGKLVADIVVDRGISIILDVSQFEHDTDKARFGTDFASRFFFRKKASPSAVHIFLEEAQEFIPQNPDAGEKMMLHAFNRMWKIGRNFGIGGSIISQRPQEVNKKALNLSQCLFAFQTMGKHEREAIESWIEDKALDLDIANDLPKLKVGEPHVWAPSWLGISETVKIAKKWTFDASETPEVGRGATVRHLAKIEMEKISEAMKDTVERAKENDPSFLKKRIRELEAEKRKGKPPDEADTSRAMERARTEAVKESAVKIRTLEQKSVRQEQLLRKIAELAVGTAIQIPKSIPAPEVKRPVQTPRSQEPKPEVKREEGDRPFNKPEREILSFLASNPDKEWKDVQIAAMIGYSPRTGSFLNGLYYLNAQGFVRRIGKKTTLVFVPEGIETDREFNVTNIRRALSGAELKVFDFFLKNPDQSFTDDEAASAVGYAPRTGSFLNALYHLNSIEIIVRERGVSRLSDEIKELV